MWGAGEVVAGRDNNCASSDRGNLVETTESTRSLRMTMLGWKSGLVTDAALTRESRRSEGLVTGCGLLDGCDRRASERLDVFIERDGCGQKGGRSRKSEGTHLLIYPVELKVLWHGYGHPQAVASGHKPVASIWPVLSRNGGERQKKSQAWWRRAWSGSGSALVAGRTWARLRRWWKRKESLCVDKHTQRPCSSAARGRRAVAYGRGGRGCARWSESPAAVVVLVLLAVVVVAYGAVVLAVVACGRLRRMGLRRQGGGAVRGAEEEEGKDGCGGTRRRSERRDAADKHAQTAAARRLSATSRAATERGWSTV
ncbi:hypothetical protein B0H14DRAFT_2616862 [Mycena olivaceomarginata]|nr:hypothetical protein B0H14DRAFT_2616862 [Mycena olivaceomarginata]